MAKLPDDFEDFVSKEVASLCDADPSVLAQYIVALIGTGELNDDLKNSLSEKLSEFFDDQTAPFIDRLFAKINSAKAEPPIAMGAAIEQSSSFSTRNNDSDKQERERYESDDEDDDRNFKHRRQKPESSSSTLRDSRPPYKRRLEDDTRSSSSKYYRTDDRNDGQYHDRFNRGGSRGSRGRGGAGYRNQSRPQCRDYNEKGFCMRGDMCPYDHGLDRIIVNDGARGFPSPNGPAAPRGRPPQPPPPPFFGMPGMATDAYDPERSGILPPPANNMGGFIPPAGLIPQEMLKNMMMMSNNMRGGGRGGRGGGPHRGSRGGYSSRHHPYQQNKDNSNNTTLTVEKIPAENCQISTVNDFFAKFGTITNISVQPNLQKATIQFSTHSEAQKAYSSPDPIFDNRFVKVYWAKDDTLAAASANAPGQEQQQQPPAKATNEPDPELVAARAAELAKVREEQQKSKQEHIKQILEVQKKREAQLQQQIEEQKKLLDKLSNNSSNMTQAEKAELLAQLKKIQGDIDISRSAVAKGTSVDQPEGSTSAEGSATNAGNTASSEDLKKELARLEAEAAKLGIPTPSFPTSSFRGGRGGYYGRGGRGASWPRMRGGFTRMTLDNRPKNFIVKEIPAEATETELRQHFEQFGNMTAFEKRESEVYVQYSQRFEAEKAMAMGQNFPKGTLQLEWVGNEAAHRNSNDTSASNGNSHATATPNATTPSTETAPST